jgi:hypothetical protein
MRSSERGQGLGERLSSQAIGDLHGVSRQRVDELVKEGKLTRGDDGKIDSDEAAAFWTNMDPAYVQRKATAAANREAGEGADKAQKPAEGTNADAFHRARTAEAIAKAQQRRFDYETKIGKYVLREEVKRGGFKAGKLLGSKLNNAANQLAPQLVGVKDVKSAHEIISAFMQQLAQDVRDELSAVG